MSSFKSQEIDRSHFTHAGVHQNGQWDSYRKLLMLLKDSISSLHKLSSQSTIYLKGRRYVIQRKKTHHKPKAWNLAWHSVVAPFCMSTEFLAFDSVAIKLCRGARLCSSTITHLSRLQIIFVHCVWSIVRISWWMLRCWFHCARNFLRATVWIFLEIISWEDANVICMALIVPSSDFLIIIQVKIWFPPTWLEI